jgi:uncharacterized protein involved in exopolysaccharide biosynthesis
MELEAIREQTYESLAPLPDSDGMDVLEILIVLCRRWRFIALFTLGAAIVCAVAVRLIPSQFTAETLVLPPVQNSSMSAEILNQLTNSPSLASAAGASLGLRSTGTMYVALFRSRTVEDAVIRRFGLMERYRATRTTAARSALEQHSTVALDAKDGLIRISVRDSDPKMAADIANGYVDEFRKFSVAFAITETSQRRVFFQQQLQDAATNLAAAKDAMKTQQLTGTPAIDSKARSLIESTASLQAQVTAKELQLQSMRFYATELNPDVIEVKDQLAALRGQLVQLSGSGNSTNADVIVSKGNIPEADTEYLRKLHDLIYDQTLKGLIAKQLEIAKLDEARQGAVIQVADPAVTPDVPSFPRRKITVFAVTVLGFVLACFWSILSEEFRRMRNDPIGRQRLEALRTAFRTAV